MASDALVYVIEDDDAMRDSLSFLLASAEIPAKTFRSADLFLADARPDMRGCIVSDIRMPGTSGMELLNELKSRGYPLPVILITGHGDIALAVAAMKIGAADFFEKPFDDDQFLAAVRSALAGTKEVESRDAARTAVHRRIEALSPRERQVLEALVEGRPNKTIAFDLGISPRTVEVYRANLMTKMHAGSLSELVRMALLVGFADPTPPAD